MAIQLNHKTIEQYVRDYLKSEKVNFLNKDFEIEPAFVEHTTNDIFNLATKSTDESNPYLTFYYSYILQQVEDAAFEQREIAANTRKEE